MIISKLLLSVLMGDANYAGLGTRNPALPPPKGMPADSGNEVGIKLRLPCYAFINAADLFIAKRLCYYSIAVNAHQNQALINLGGTYP
jgi:hypothetical protein